MSKTYLQQYPLRLLAGLRRILQRLPGARHGDSIEALFPELYALEYRGRRRKAPTTRRTEPAWRHYPI